MRPLGASDRAKHGGWDGIADERAGWYNYLMTRHPPMFRLVLVALGLAALPLRVPADGLYADFTTSMGDFTVELDFVRAPRTVANFIRLAEGTQVWMDPGNGAVETEPWFAGSALYRIQYAVPAAGTTNVLALQGGLRSVGGSYNAGPGYTILDEALNGLSHSNGVIAMVADGPHTGAAEFMLLLTNGAAYWDGRQTVFGRVSAGTNVVRAIATGGQTDGMLHTPAAISGVAIRRVGAVAEAFAVDRADLPAVQADGCRVDMLAGDSAQYVCVKAPQSETWMAHTADLLNPQWSLYSFGFNGTTQAVDVTTPFSTAPDGWSRHFFHGTRVDYPIFSAIPLDEMAGITFAAEWGDGTVYQYWLNLSARTGFWQNVTTTGAVVRINDPFYMVSQTRGGNCTHFNFMDVNGNVFDYVLGFEAKGATTGRYYLELTSGWTGESLGTEWGDCQYAPWNPGVNATSLAAKYPSRDWPSQRQGPVFPRGIQRLETGGGGEAADDL